MPDAGQPNILFVMCDQLSALATSPYGNQDVLTPNLSRLSQRGTLFEHSYCNSPLCAPSRASMLTGRLASSIPVNDNAEELPASVPTFVHHLRRGGYKTILSGKMHFIGPDQLHGFETRLTTDIYPGDFLWTKYWPAQGDPPRRVGLPGGGKDVGRHYDLRTREMSQMVKEAGAVPWNYQVEHDEEVHFQTLQQLRRFARRRGDSANQPWFLCVSYTQPHDPYVASPEYWDRYEDVDFAMPEEPPADQQLDSVDVWVNTSHGLDRVRPTREDVYRSRRGYYAMISYIDDKVGELVGELERLGQLEETIIVFTSDHGDMVGEHGMWHKRTCREWSSRVPLIFAGPGTSPGSRVEANVSLVDLYPTLVEIADLEMPDAHFVEQLAGRSFAPFLRGDRPADWSNRVIIENNGEGTIKPVRTLLEDRLKYIYVHERTDQLFDLDKDPGEWRNVVDDPSYKEAASQLREELLGDWDPVETEREVLASQVQRMFVKDALYEGEYTPWDYRPVSDASRRWVRKTSNDQWDPDLGF